MKGRSTSTAGTLEIPLKMQVGGGGSSAERAISSVPAFVRTLNASTKWFVTLVNTIGVWSRPREFNGPYIVVGSIAAVYLTEILKKIINQNRPEGSPFTDPGMPSAHSLVCFFAAVGWMSSPWGEYFGPTGKASFLAAASSVAILRVVCGYHSVAQIAVGAGLGSALGWLWVALGDLLHVSHPRVTFGLAWVAYLGGSAIFIKKRMGRWVSGDKHL
eukprot:CAMPEP_0172503268 /NCGR_PEP_ID=MMETSP1066-20121228/167740_1 /TAXON_ID=671091 /ORGANISM="Coscinodiscus wailesii, Strain CCMP2513" /LENGTH=215 /DNA_ID=CAMNT_0013278935 /DNA_START=217 /DNA_END=864 /DNA_ORIENTATION=-